MSALHPRSKNPGYAYALTFVCRLSDRPAIPLLTAFLVTFVLLFGWNNAAV